MQQLTFKGTRRPPPPKEQDVMNAIKHVMQLSGLRLVDRRNSGSFKTEAGHWIKGCMKGTPDLFGIDEYGTAYFVEVKREGQVATKEQEEYIAEAKKAGAFAAVVYSPEEFLEKYRLFREWKYGSKKNS